VRSPLGSALQTGDVVLSSQDCDRNAAANNKLCAPARYRALPSIAYRLALIAAGEGEAAVSLNGPTHWDYCAGHALLRGAGGDLFNDRGEAIGYNGQRAAGGKWIFGGSAGVAAQLSARPWADVFKPEATQPAITQQWPLVKATHALRCPSGPVLARAQGVLLGQVAGDALGQLVEFRPAADIARRYPNGVRDLVDGGAFDTLAGQPTDDSELALILARSLVQQRRFDAASVLQAYRAWRDSGPFDIGGTTRRGLAGNPDPQSQANGALMRVSPVALWAWQRTPAEIAQLARAEAAPTHPHPACADASAVFCVAIAHALQNASSGAEAHAAALSWAKGEGAHASVVAALEHAIASPPPEFQRQMGWVLIALQNAFYQLLHAPSLEEGVIDTVRRGGDTDTNGAIAGALLGAVHGREGVPLRWRRAVLSCRPIGGTRPRPKTFWPVDLLDLAEQLLAHGPKSGLD
jgi:ADP-ribosylglycohydrolase